MTDNFEKQLSAKLGNRSIAPSGEAWQRIAHNRQQDKVVRKKNSFLKYVAALILILAIASVWFLLPAKNAGVTPQVASPVKPIKTAGPSLQQNEKISSYKEELATLAEGISYDTLQHAKGAIATVVAVAAQPDGIEVNSIPTIEVLSKNIQYKNETDDLLNDAMKQVAASKQLAPKTNDTALLKEVQAEMDQYYRDKAMKIFSLEHKTIRIAVRDKQ